MIVEVFFPPFVPCSDPLLENLVILFVGHNVKRNNSGRRATLLHAGCRANCEWSNVISC